ncbi:induced myeloid leukemia cell differentiation protein Mcl-1b [Odontesthes bonariensis]|uniref:induced myeloid leukemia cell differentiation protein Mcl-1b n=1 Tax=Odontesthes bonariensis TaxID=219752 RepID=UPI003F583627
MYPIMSNRSLGCLIVPQNGVSDVQMLLRPGHAYMQVAVDSSSDPHNVIDGSVDIPKRPTNLGVVSSKGYPAKSFREVCDDADSGSLPCTPELHSDSEIDVSNGHAGDEVLDNVTRQLITSFLRDFNGLPTSKWSETKALSTMRRVVEKVLDKHKFAYNGMINKLSLDNTGDDMKFVGVVAQSLFEDRITNWGRIASLVAFGAVVSQHLKERGRENCVDLVGQEISTYLLSNQRDWLVKNNSWDGFVEFFQVADPESKVRNTLMAFAGVAGIGATLALLIR